MTMTGGIDLTLMIGPAVPVPVSKDILDALAGISVTCSAGKASGFELTFNLVPESPLYYLFKFMGGAQIPMVRVIVAVTVNGSTDVLIDGVMTEQGVESGSGGDNPKLVVKGEDLSRIMDYLDFSGMPYPCMPAEARVALILAKYAAFGVIPMVIPSPLIDIPLPTESIPAQKGKDLGYIKELADQVGYVFYLDPGPEISTSIAYWGPEIKSGPPQPALTMDMDPFTNVEDLAFTFDSEKATRPIVNIQEPITKATIPISIPQVTPFSPLLGLIPPIPKSTTEIKETAKYSGIRGLLIGMAKAAQTSDVVQAQGSLNVLRYGQVLKARRLVGVRGAGWEHDGLYYVKSVTHNIKRGEYKQSFTLTRNALVSGLSELPI
jgi:hypothetical protein